MDNKGIFIGSSCAFEIYAANKLFDSGIISSVIFEEGRFNFKNNDSRVKKFNQRNFFLNYLWGKQEFHNQRILKSKYKYLDKKIKFFKTSNINSDDISLKIKELNPSFVIVNGARIMKEKLFQDFCGKFINIDWGASPEYKDIETKTPIYFRDWGTAEFTIQVTDKGIDSGEIICKDKIDIDEADNFYSIGLKMTKQAVEYLTNGLIIGNRLNNLKLVKQISSQAISANSKCLEKNKIHKLLSPVSLIIKKIQIKCLRKSKIFIKSLIGIFTYPLINESDIVYLFHEVTNNPSEFATSHNLFIENKIFEEQIKWISKKYRIIDPIELLNGSNFTSNNQKKNALITFDDGLETIFKNAAPILRKYGLRAIVFLNMGPIQEEDFYSGLICYLNSKDYYFKKNMKRIYPKTRDEFLFFKKSDIKNFSNATQTHDFANKLKKYHGEFATLDQLNKNNDVFVYGSHFYNHFNAVNLTKSELAFQIGKNSKELKKLNGNPELFSYPFGQPDTCYNSETDNTIFNLGVKKIFYSNIMQNTSFSNSYFYRVATENNFNFGYMNFISIFKPFYKQFLNDLKNKN